MIRNLSVILTATTLPGLMWSATMREIVMSRIFNLRWCIGNVSEVGISLYVVQEALACCFVGLADGLNRWPPKERSLLESRKKSHGDGIQAVFMRQG